jgi:ATP synthase protein I
MFAMVHATTQEQVAASSGFNVYLAANGWNSTVTLTKYSSMTLGFNTIVSSEAQSSSPEALDGLFDTEFKPLTAAEASQWRRSNPSMSPWWVVAWQLLIGLFFALCVVLFGGADSGWSAAYGTVCVALPAALMVYGLWRQRLASDSGAAMFGFVVWEFVKVALTVAMLLLAPKLFQPLSWLALVAGFVVTMKVYWVAAWLHSRRNNRDVTN